MTKTQSKQTYKQFKEWVDNQTNQAEAMGLAENYTTLAEMLENNAQAWVQIQEMLESHELHYQPKRKHKKRPNMISLILDLYKLEAIGGTLEVLQEDISSKYQQVFCETRLELDELVSGLLAVCLDCITPRESALIDKIQESEVEDA